MNFLDIIYTRRSIRKFTGEVINDEQLQAILKAGFAAPSAHNMQPWEFIVVKDKEKMEKIAQNHPYCKMLPNARTGLVVCGDTIRQKSTGFLIQDCSAAMQNMLLAAHSLNLGAVWCGIYPVTNLINLFRETLNLPENIVPVAIMVVGFKSEDRQPSNRYDEHKIHYDNW